VKKNQVIKILAIVLLPLILAGLYVISVQIGSIFRYDQAFFGPQFQETYASPGAVARALEGALQYGDEQLYAELSGLKRTPADMAPHPELHFSILVDVDEQDYFHYLYFDMGTMRRNTQYVKEIKGRWVTVPQDAFFYLDSGQWMKVFMPLSVFWWGLLLAFGIMKTLARVGSHSRAAFGW
jgi:hypothetical protein